MVTLMQLWLPIVLSAVIAFVASSVMHMVLKYHRNDYKRLPDEEKAAEALRSLGLPPGEYAFPCPSDPKDMGSPEMLARYAKGPVGFMTLIPNGPPAMPKYLAQWFGFCLLISAFAAYLTGRTVAPGAEYLMVFRVAGTVAFLGYGAAHVVDSIWKCQAWSTTLKHVFDGLIYALLTAGTFGWLWPAA